MPDTCTHNLNAQYYNQNAREFVDSTFNVDMQPLYAEFLPSIPAGGHILDAGCGSGRDAKAFKELGFKITAIDASEELVKIASQTLGQKVEHKTFQQITEINTFEGIWCCASLLHVPLNEISAVFTRLSTALKLNGVLYVSFKYGEPSYKNQREHNGRLFTDLNEQSLNELISTLPNLTIQKTWQTQDTRPERAGDIWLNAVIFKNNSEGKKTGIQNESQEGTPDSVGKNLFLQSNTASDSVGTNTTQEQLLEFLQKAKN